MNEFRTYQTRLDLNCEQAALLDANAALYGKAERSLFARLSAGASLSVLKREFIGGLGITARQFNALAAGVRGKIASVKAVRDRLIEFAKRRIKRAEEVLAEIPDKWKRHQKRRRIATLKARLANLESERDAGKMGIWRGEWRVSGGDCRVSSRSPRSYSRRIAAGMCGACGPSSPAETEWRLQRGGGRVVQQPDPRRHRLLRARPAP